MLFGFFSFGVIFAFLLLMVYIYSCQYRPWRKLKVTKKRDPNLLEIIVVGVVATDGTDLVWSVENPRQQQIYFLVRLHENFNDENSRAYKYFRHYFITDGNVCYNVEKKVDYKYYMHRYSRARLKMFKNAADSVDRNSDFRVEVRPFLFSIPRNWFDGIQRACADYSTQLLEEQQCSKTGAQWKE